MKGPRSDFWKGGGKCAQLLALSCLLRTSLLAQGGVDYATEIQPLFASACSPCHIGQRTSGVELGSYQEALESVGEQFQGAVVAPHRPYQSPLWEKVARLSPRHGARMPRDGAPLSRQQIDLVARWIDEGALPAAAELIRGDVDASGSLSITDAVYLLRFLFQGGPGPSCASIADADANGQTNLTDAIVILLYLFAGGPPPPALAPGEEDDCARSGLSRHRPGCSSCHEKIEDIHTAISLACTDCHGGDPLAVAKETAHVSPSLPVIQDGTTPPLDYDLPYQRFVNPSNLRVVKETCGTCHEPHIDWILKSLMATGAGHYAGGLYQGGVTPSKKPLYGNFAVSDDDGVVPIEKGAVDKLLDLIRYDPFADQSLFSTHYRAVPGQACARCHLWSRGKGYRGAVGAEGTYRADGCAACHMLYDNGGRSLSADASINHEEPGHPRIHQTTRAIPTEQCGHCHYRGARIGLSFTGLSQMPPGLPSGPGVAGTTDVKFDGSYHYSDRESNPPDVHGERGMHCIDCHVQSEVMGDGNVYGHMDQATKIDCRTCHGAPQAESSLVDAEGKRLPNVQREPQRGVVLTSKVDALEHVAPQLKEFLDPGSPSFNPRAAAAMNANHLKDKGGLECYSCHSAWVPNCFGCHFERDERQSGLNLLTREKEIGKASTNNKVFVSLKHFAMGPDARGRIAPYIVGCQPIADVTAADGSKKLDFVMPATANGLSGLALNPVNPHTTRGIGEVRTCAECHRSPATLGLGSGNYSLARKRAFVVTDAGVAVYDRLTDPTRPALLGTLAAQKPRAIAALPDVVSGEASYLYVASGEAGLLVFDLRAGLPERPVATLPGIEAIDVSRAGRQLHVVVKGVGVMVCDSLDPATVTPLATVPIPTALRAVPWGIHLLVAAGTAGLIVVDISDPNVPSIAGSLAGIRAADVVAYAHYQIGPAFAARAYVADPDFGVRIVSLLPEPSKPSLVGALELPGAMGLDTYTRYLVTDGTTPSREHDYLYVAAGAAGLHVFDITSPEAPIEASALATLGGVATDVDVASQMKPPGVDDYAFIANAALGLQLVDVSDPRSPVLLMTVGPPGASRALVEVQAMDRFIDEEGNALKENSHPGAGTLSRQDIVRILKADIGGR